MRNCISEETLQAWFDGELAANEAGAVAAHLSGCANCAEVARTVETENLILSRALVTEFDGPIPTERLRERVDTAVAALHHPSMPTVSRPLSQAAREFFASFRPLAYASIVAVILLAGFVVFVFVKKDRTQPGAPDTVRSDSGIGSREIAKSPKEKPADPTPSLVLKKPKVGRTRAKSRTRDYEPDAMSLAWQQRQYDYAIAKLNEAIKVQPVMSPSVQVEYAYDMALIDNAIVTGRAAARRNPKDPQSAQYMLAAYQSKVDLMNQIATARGLEK